MKENKKAVVAGHICLDITPVFSTLATTEINKIFSPGKLIQMNEADIHTGGCVANTGLAMKILGADVCLMGKVGNDDFGKIVHDILKKHNAEKELIISQSSNTSYSIVLAIAGIDRIFLHHPGANDTFTYSDMNWDTIKEASVFHFGYPTIIKQMYLDSGKELQAMFKKVKGLGVGTSLDLSAVDANSEAGREDWDLILKNVLPYVDFFVPSVEELCFMIDRRLFDEWTARANGKEITEVITLSEVKTLAKKVMEYGAKVILIKCGAKGMYYQSADCHRITELCDTLGLNVLEWSDKEGFEISYKPEAVLSGTGAGDSSIAAFLTAVLEEESLETALKMATATGASCVATYDALSGLLPYTELKEKITNGWEKNKITLN